MPSLFSNLGEEWVPAPVKRTTGFKGGKAPQIIEWMVLILADLMVAFILAIFLIFIILIAHAATNPVEALWTYGLKPLCNALH
jgi:hypothetical protein